MSYKLPSLLMISLLLNSCAKEQDSFVGSYKLESALRYCGDLRTDYYLDFSHEDCGAAIGFEYCEEGTLNIAADGSFTSDLKFSKVHGGNIYAIIGEGTYLKKDNIATICLFYCQDFEIVDDKLISLYSTGVCKRTYVLRKI